ncbi:MAG: protein kinase [Actinomadura sp.]
MPDGADRGPPVNAPGAPRVPRVKRAPSSPRFPYVVTEFIDGPSLRVLVERDGPQSGPALYRLAIGTATALAAVHQAGVVHRDLKPGNVLVGPDGPRVIDFGVARSLDATLTATSTVIGTPSYMAPEQLAGEAVGPAADVFAWGATIAYAANGRPPFGQDTIPAVMTRIMSGRPDLGGLTGPLRDLVAQSLHRDPAKRPHSRDVLLRLLEHSHGPIAAPEALAQGRALATADDATLADERTARWATVRLPASPPKRPVFQRRVLVIGTLAAAALLTATVAMALRNDPGDHPLAAMASTPSRTAPPTRPARPAAPVTGPPTTPSDVAAAVEKAVTAHRTAAFTAAGGMDQSADHFESAGRLYFRPGQSTNYDLTARTDLDNGLYAGSSGPRIIILGNCGYFRTDPRACNPLDARSLRRRYDALMWTAAEVRWVSSPYNVFALLRNSPSLSRSTNAGTVTYRATAPGGRLAAGGPTAPFYQEFGNDLTKVTYTLVTSRDHLPERLDIDLWTSVQPGLTYHSLYSVTYRDWGRTGTITRSY